MGTDRHTTRETIAVVMQRYFLITRPLGGREASFRGDLASACTFGL